MTKLLEASLQLTLTGTISLLSVSDGIEALLGFTATDYLSSKVTLQSQIHNDDQDIVEALFSTDISEPYTTFNIRIRHADGRIRCIKGTATKERNNKDNSVTLDLLLQDARSLWQTSANQTIMNNFKAMMENTDDYIYFKDRNHVFTGASQTLVELTAPSESWTDLLGQTDYDVFPEEYADIYYHLEKLVFSGLHVAHEVQETLDNDGQKGWVDNRKYPMHDDSGDIIGLFGIARDITEQQMQKKKIEQLLSEQNIILDNQLVGIVTVRDRHVLWANSAIETMLDYDEDEMIGLSTRQFYVREEDYQSIGLAYNNIEHTGVVRNEMEFIRKDGLHIWVEMRGAVLHQNTEESIWIFVDITERMKAEEQLRASEKRLRLSQRYGGVGTWEYNYITNKSICSENVFQELGFPWSEDKSSWDDVFDAILLEDRENVATVIEQHIKQDSLLDVEYRIKDTEGKIRWMRSTGKVEFGEDNEPLMLRGTVLNITAQKTAEDKLRIASVAFETQEGITVTDINGVILNVNSAFSEISGYSEEDVIGNTPKILQSGQHDSSFYSVMWDTISQTGRWQGEITNRHKKGYLYIERLTITAVKDANGQVINYVGTHTDITSRKAIEEEVAHLAFYDHLTQLPNRRLLLDRLHQAVKSNSRSDKSGALMFLDLDHFKVLNDTQGHHIGDLLLQQVAERLIMSVRDGDTVARLGGDEFVVMLEGLSKKTNEAVVQADIVARKILTSLNQPYSLANNTHKSGASIGITLFNDKNSSDINEFLRQADIAMYEAKRQGRNDLRFYDSSMV